MPEASPPAVLLDTCAAIWLVNGDRMTAPSRRAIAAAQQSGGGVYVSPITAWEVATLLARGRLRLAMAAEAWFERLLALPGVRLAAMPPEVLIASAFLPGTPPRDPADRIIAATGRAYALAIVTRNGELTPYGRAGYIATIPC
jgi:PIN domain nuclease of toxin-antitoxin system